MCQELALPLAARGLPATHVMTTRNYARFDSLGNPRGNHVIPNLRFNSDKVTSLDAVFICVRRVNPKWVGVRNFVKPLGVRATSVNLNCESESGNENCLIGFEIVGMDVTLDVSRDRVLGPPPVV